MPRFIKKTSKKAGLSPGTLVHIGEKKAETAKFALINYDQEQLQERELASIDESFPFLSCECSAVSWVLGSQAILTQSAPLFHQLSRV